MFAAGGNANTGKSDGYMYVKRSEARTIRNRRKPGLCD